MINKEIVKQFAEKWIETLQSSQQSQSSQQPQSSQQSQQQSSHKSNDKGFFLVDVKVKGDNQISIEIETERGSVDIDDCTALNAFMESHLDREVEDYSLEISSAGLGQPFKVRKQYLKYIGQDVEVSLKDGHRFVGILQNVEDESFCVNVMRKVKPEGAKRPINQAMDETYRYDEVNSVCYHLDF